VSLPSDVAAYDAHDPAALAAVVGDARVVAIGENNHHVREFGELRLRLVQQLVDELGFTVVAMESGHAEGMLVDSWVQGGPGELADLAAAGFTFRFGDAPEVRALIAWLRGHGGVTFAGLDVPGSGGDPRPALELVRARVDDPVLVDAAIAATSAYAGANNGAAAGRYAQLDTAARDAATAALARLALQLFADADAATRHLALGALRLDEQLRELAALIAGAATGRVRSSRDVYMADTVRFLQAQHPGARIVVLAHNGHLQRTPTPLVPGVTTASAGTYLARDLGTDYRAIGVTAIGGTTTEARLDPAARHGIAVDARPLDPPAAGSIEEAVRALDGPALLDLRPARGAAGPTSIRHAHLHAEIDVCAAFDALVCLPEMHPSDLTG
jgi:erythromycin esterase